jgi:hypothetical protein
MVDGMEVMVVFKAGLAAGLVVGLAAALAAGLVVGLVVGKAGLMENVDINKIFNRRAGCGLSPYYLFSKLGRRVTIWEF